MEAAGDSSVPCSRSCWTGISTLSRRMSIVMHHAVLGQAAGTRVVSAVVHARPRRDAGRSVHLVRGDMHVLARGVLQEDLHRRDLGGAGTADAPGLLEHAAAGAAFRV